MKKVFFYMLACAAILGEVILMPACKKCATCTYEDEVNGQDTSDYCGRGNTYEEWIFQHKRSGWKCVEE